MPESLTPDAFTLRIDDDVPTVDLHDARITDEDGWQVLVRATVVVVDGPGDEGFLLRRLTDDGGDAAPDGWEDAVRSAGGVTVRAGGTTVRAALTD